MDEFTACECAYKQGYEKGLKDAVKHGRWEREKVPWLIVKGEVVSTSFVYMCSVCELYEDTKTKFCPNCGAKMDLEKTK